MVILIIIWGHLCIISCFKGRYLLLLIIILSLSILVKGSFLNIFINIWRQKFLFSLIKRLILLLSRTLNSTKSIINLLVNIRLWFLFIVSWDDILSRFLLSAIMIVVKSKCFSFSRHYRILLLILLLALNVSRILGLFIKIISTFRITNIVANFRWIHGSISFNFFFLLLLLNFTL